MSFRRERTTAHDHLHSFYGGMVRTPRQKSVLDWICTAPSEFALEMAMKDAVRLNGHATRRQWRQWIRAAISRVHELRGWVM